MRTSCSILVAKKPFPTLISTSKVPARVGVKAAV